MSRYIKRYEDGDRINHWVLALTFFLAGLSGLAFFHPSLFFLSNLFGGGQWTRILHPFLGTAMFAVFAAFFFAHLQDNILTEADKVWQKEAGRLMLGNGHDMPPSGKFNAGQKMLFWFMVLCMLGLMVTGIVFWRPWFAQFFPIGLIRTATLLHAVAAAGLILLVIGHIYMSIWTRGSIRGMTRGTVTDAWARQNHALWHREVTGRK